MTLVRYYAIINSPINRNLTEECACMKKICFSIAIMIFGYIVETSFNLEMFAFMLAVIGLIFAIVGLCDKTDK